MSDHPKRIAVAMIGQYAVPAIYGGVERVVEELGAELVAHGVDVTVYCSRSDPPAPALYRGMRLRVVPEIRGKITGKLSLAAFATLDALRRPYDVVHFHAMGPCLFAPLLRMFRPRVAVCSTIHSRDDRFAKWTGLVRAMFRIAAWCAAHVPHHVMVVSETLRDEVEEDFGIQATVVRNGFAPVRESGPDEELRRWDLTPGKYMLFVGRMVHEKATDDLVMAFGRTDIDWKLVIVGESAHTDDFERTVRNAAAHDERVIFAGPLYGAPLDALYRNAGAFCLPSRLEGMPIVLLEAIGYGVPVIVSDIAANLEVVRFSGPGHRVFPVGDLAALADTLEMVASQRTIEKAGADVLQRRILNEFSWSNASKIALNVYNSIVSVVSGR